MDNRSRHWALLASICVWGCGASGNDSAENAATSTAPLQKGTSEATRSVNPLHREPSGTRTPIKHAVIIIGENRTFDHIFATYKPRHHQRIYNLLSQGIVEEGGRPGPHFNRATQMNAVDAATDGYALSPGSKAPYGKLPPPLTGGPTNPYISDLATAKAVQAGLPDNYYQYLVSGGTGLPPKVVDTRIVNVNDLPPGPFQLTPGVAYNDYAASPVHRFYQMWQQLDCMAHDATFWNPSGCKSDLFPWVEVSVGAGSNGNPQPTDYSDLTTGEGSTAMGFYNMLQGDAPYFKYLADTYAMSDNYHQAVQGGTGANHVMLGTGDDVWYSDGKGHALVPPALNTENPNAQPGTNNWYTQDGYSGGTYSNCADASQPGVGAVVDYLTSLPRSVDPNCEANHYYLLNNYAPGYFADGSVNTDQFAIPPSNLRTIGDELGEHHISWAYFGDQYNRYRADPHFQDPTDVYCDICNPFQYVSSIMTDATERQQHLKDTLDFYQGIRSGVLPAVSFVKPSGLVDGHPASSKLNLFEGFTKYIVDLIQSQPELWKDTVIFVTFDEGGGYYDSGYVQPVDFFGDGTRIPLMVISPFSKGGKISHEYGDHVSLLKFIEYNWYLPPVTGRSRDNLPNPITSEFNPYAPINSPAIGDLTSLFDFDRGD
jgi:phospholipase C